jgi:GTP-binding protein HflX
LNSLTGADVSVEDQLFHTLDPTTRGFDFEGRRYLVTDTVGFIRRLPHHLVEGFASTLEETLVADVVLHVVDASALDDEQDRQCDAVGDVLHEIGAGELPVVIVLNKIDRVDPLGRRRLTNRFPDAPHVSALTGEGLEQLKSELARRFEDRWERVRLLVPYADGGRLAELYALGAPVEEREDTPEGVLLIARLPRRERQRFAPFLVAESRSQRESA